MGDPQAVTFAWNPLLQQRQDLWWGSSPQCGKGNGAASGGSGAEDPVLGYGVAESPLAWRSQLLHGEVPVAKNCRRSLELAVAPDDSQWRRISVLHPQGTWRKSRSRWKCVPLDLNFLVVWDHRNFKKINNILCLAAKILVVCYLVIEKNALFELFWKHILACSYSFL